MSDEELPEEDLWFLPGPPEDDLPPGAIPMPQAKQSPLFDPAVWRQAQDARSDDLARLAQLFGELDLRMRGAPAGLRQRLALREASDLSWWCGDRLALDRLSLWHVLRVGATEDTEQAFARAGWALRRLSGGVSPVEGVGAFLERASDGADPDAVIELAGLLDDIGELHPVTQAAMLFQAWRMLGFARSREIEGATLAARHAASMSRKPGQGAMFLPLAMSGADTFRLQGPPEAKLGQWIAGAERATLAALLHLDMLADWQSKAGAAVAGLSGRTPGRLIDVFATWPLVTAPLAQAETGASRASIQRNLDRLAGLGLIRELTGQGRYRVWGMC